ncbi:MAG: nucleoside kinase [Lachnospiraceae bacterium]|nr:nucleoside kinase [Lachnospiraceae bacterium]
MYQLTYKGKTYTYPEGATYKDAAADLQKEKEEDILLLSVNGKLQELRKKIQADAAVNPITTADTVGMETYRRSLVLLAMKSIYDVLGHSKVEKATVHFSVSKGLYMEVRGDFDRSTDWIARIEERMRQLVGMDLPIEKEILNTDDAVDLFHRLGMYDKEKLFHFRRVSKVNIYRLNEFQDYYYGYMAPSTGYLKYFRLCPYSDGFVLQMPVAKAPKEVPPFAPQNKVFQVLKEASDWSEKLGIHTVGALNERIVRGDLNEVILVQEALMEKKLGEIAAMIAARPHCKFIMIAGPSSSGKTTFSHRLSVQLTACGLKPHPIAVDNYFVNREDTPRDEDGNLNYECLEALDVEQFNKDMSALLRGECVEIPSFNFVKGKREYKGDYKQLGESDILVIEGIHGLNDALSYSLPAENKFKIYISALTQLSVDEHNRIPTTDGRLIRRIVRDARTRGSSARDTIAMWPSVRKGEEDNIFPYQEQADVVFNSSLIYELAALKIWAEPLLFAVPKNSAEYWEAKRLLKFFDYFLPIDNDDVPANSLLREFIGGGCFGL